MTYFKFLSDFMKESGPDLFNSFCNFCANKYPLVWDQLNQFYADGSIEGINPRLSKYGWDSLLNEEYFPQFLSSLKDIWLLLSNQGYGNCFYCKKETELEIDHPIIVSYDYGPVIKFYHHNEMDGAASEEVYTCRSCAVKALKKLAEIACEERVTCWV